MGGYKFVNVLARIFIIFYFVSSLSISLYSQVTCCCGTPKLIDFQGLDFEFDPYPAPAGYIPYTAGSSFGPWIVTQGAVDHGDKDYCGVLAAGNPNGASAFVDLFGSPSTGSIAGTMIYPLTGLTPGYIYTIEFWYATFTSNGSFSANLKVANGAWLDVNWTANNPGSAVWLKKSYNFTANATSATLALKDTGPSSSTYQIGMLMDDIKIFECAVDLEKPVVENPQEDLEVACEKDVPLVPNLLISDNCDVNPQVTFKESKENTGPCSKKLTRTWMVRDACGNINEEIQTIDIIDRNPPQFTSLPVNLRVHCHQDVLKEFNDWIRNNGQSAAADDCGNVSWKTSFERTPHKFCDSVKVEFTAVDDCGLENSETGYFIVQDTMAIGFSKKPENKNLSCVPEVRDSLSNWLINYGFSSAAKGCDTAIWSHNFNGDSTKNPLHVTFYVRDRCGHVDSSTAIFSYRGKSDTIHHISYSCAFPKNSIDTIKYSVLACDSIVILEKIKLEADTVFIEENTCDPNQKLSDTLWLTNMHGCDSLIFYQYILQPTSKTLIKNYDCSLQKYSTDTISWSGQYCDSLVIIENIPLRNDSIFIQNTSCDSSEVGQTIEYFKNEYGCDSIVVLSTTFIVQQITQITKNECGLLVDYIDTVRISTGHCDSLVITRHLALSLDSILITRNTCDPLMAGQFTQRFSNQYGCDSVVIELVNLKPTDSIFLYEKTCTLSNAGKRIIKFSNQFGCDSIVLVDTKFIPSDTSRIIQHTCDLKNAGMDTIIYTTTICDSVVFFERRFKAADTTFTDQFSCDAFKIGIDTFLLQNQTGCDSMIFVRTIYRSLQLNYLLDSIQCHNQSDGRLLLTNDSTFSMPFEFYLNQKKFTNLLEVQHLAPGDYEVFLKDGKGCITDTVRFTLLNPEALITELGADLEVEKGTIVKLTLQSNKKLTNIYWQPNKYSNCTICDEIDFVADQDSWIYTLSIDERNCSSLDSVFIRVKDIEEFYVPSLISPNGDQVNDHFYILGPDKGRVEKLVIYDRWGTKVFEVVDIPVNQPLLGWNGNYQFQPLNPGVYVFYARIKTDNRILELSGDFTLLR